MSDNAQPLSRSGVFWNQFLNGQTFGVAFAVILFVLEVLLLRGEESGRLGASATAVFAVYAAFGWVLGAAAGALAGLAGAVSSRLRRDDGTVAGLGPFLGFLFMALFILRFETVKTLKEFPASVLISLVAAAGVWIGMGYLGRRFLTRYVPGERRPITRKVLAAAAFFTMAVPAVVSGVASGRLPERKAQSAASPNIVLIVVDALRPDHLSVYGYGRDTSPNLERFAENATVFDNAYSHGNRTVIAMPSLFTGLYPSFHGVVGRGEMMIPLQDSRTTIAEMCRDAGYVNVGLMSNVFLKSPYGLTQGFDRVEEFETGRYTLSVYRVLMKCGLVTGPSYRQHLPDATTVTNFGIKWLKRLGQGPFFLFLHYMDVHHPYTPPSDFVRMFDRGEVDIDPGVLFMKTAAMKPKSRGMLDLPEGELNRLIDLYDGCIRYTDEEIGRFLYELSSLDLERETIVIITADHGDEFLENGSIYHTNLVIESLIRVPLMIARIPAAGRGRRVESLVRHVDVLPTIADWIGVKCPDGVQGGSLKPLLEGDGGSVADYTIAEGDHCTSVNKGTWKIMYVDSTDTYQLFDLASDPIGTTDVYERYPAQAAEMKAILDEYLVSAAQLQRGDEEELSPETIHQLKALGYIE